MAKPEIILELCVPDFDRAVEFYALLGFVVALRENDYMILEKDSKKLTFYGNCEKEKHPYFQKFPGNTPKGYGVEIVIFESDLEGLFEKIKGKAKVILPLKMQPWGKRDFSIVDPFGFYLRFCEK